MTLWATTATCSTSGDNGADPNKVVGITDQVSATTLARSPRDFPPVAGPTYGTVYRGLAYVGAGDPDHDGDHDHDEDHRRGG